MKKYIPIFFILLLTGTAVLANEVGMSQRTHLYSIEDPELAAGFAAFEQVVPGGINLEDIPATRQLFKNMTAANAVVAPLVHGVVTSDHLVPECSNSPPVKIRLYRPEKVKGTLPALFWIHGGGYVIGDIEMDDQWARKTSLALNCVIASVEYRLAPEHPYPAPLEDCYSALRWLVVNANGLGVNVDRIAIGGASAGGGLAAGLGLLVRDRAEIDICYQLLIYPMLDDTNIEQASVDIPDTPFWSRKNNLIGWSAYLQKEPGSANIPIYAAPARAKDLGGLPPTFIGVGTPDLFRDEDITYAHRLMKAGVPTELHVYVDGFHAFDVFVPEAETTKRFIADYTKSLSRALHDQSSQTNQ